MNAPLPSLPRMNMLWKMAFFATLVIPVALIYSRAVAEISVALLGIVFLTHCAMERRWEWLRDPVIKVAALFWLWMMLGVSPFALIRGESFVDALGWARFVLIYAALRYWVFVTPRALAWAAYALAALLAACTVDTLWQYVHGVSLSGHPILDGRLTGPFDNKQVGIFLSRMLVPACALLVYAQRGSSWAARAGWVGLAGSVLLAVLLSGERTAFLSSLLALGLVGVLMLLAEPRWRASILVALLGGAVALYGVYVTQAPVKMRVEALQHTLQHFPESSYGKLFHMGLILGVENPVTGVGIQGFREKCEEFVARDVLQHCALHVHNPYIEWFAETGVIGLMLGTLMVLVLLRQGWDVFRKTEGALRLIPALAMGTVVMNYFPFMATQSYFSNWPAILLWYAVAVAFAAMNGCAPSGVSRAAVRQSNESE